MKTELSFFGVALSLILTGCGGSQAHHEHHEHGEHGEHGAHEHPEMKGAVKAVHDVLSPVYHMDKGAARVEKACGDVAALREQSKAVQGEAADDAAKKRAEALLASVEELDKACAENGRPNVEANLEKVHDAFHAVLEAK